MKIKDIGGELGLIKNLAKIAGRSDVDLVAGIGDDAAVIRTAPEPAPYLLVTTDLLVEDRHFKRQWCTPEQIGLKAVTSNVSDIAAMGGRPTWMFVSLVLTAQTDASWIENLYRSMTRVCQRYGIIIAGGDTTQGSEIVINITLLGSVAQNNLCLRSHARAGDVIMVSGSLGASAAALALMEKGRQPSAYLLAKYCTPDCRLDIIEYTAPLAHAMIDISDGLGSEIQHICNQSHLGAEIVSDRIPLHPDVHQAGVLLGVDPVLFALQGGEDYELLFTTSPEKAKLIDKHTSGCYRIGVITQEKELALIHPDGQRSSMPGGYNHF